LLATRRHAVAVAVVNGGLWSAGGYHRRRKARAKQAARAGGLETVGRLALGRLRDHNLQRPHRRIRLFERKSGAKIDTGRGETLQAASMFRRARRLNGG
jgi:hypothetical protein